MRKGWTAHCITYDNNTRYLNSLTNALLHAYSLSSSYKTVTVSINDKVLAEWHSGKLIYCTIDADHCLSSIAS